MMRLGRGSAELAIKMRGQELRVAADGPIDRDTEPALDLDRHIHCDPALPGLERIIHVLFNADRFAKFELCREAECLACQFQPFGYVLDGVGHGREWTTNR